jgi:hypothetical protein
MPITMIQRSPRNASQAYDQIIATVGESLRQSPGLLSHVAQVSADGVTVTEVWETRDQWYATPVMPHLSSDAPPPAVTELHNCRREYGAVASTKDFFSGRRQGVGASSMISASSSCRTGGR